MYLTMSAPRNSKSLIEISNLNTKQLIGALKSNGVDDDCCAAVENYQIDGEEFLKLSEIQVKMWRPSLNRAQITRLWSIIQLAKDRPGDFYSPSSFSSNTVPAQPKKAPFRPNPMNKLPSSTGLRTLPTPPVLHKPPTQIKNPWEIPKPEPPQSKKPWEIPTPEPPQIKVQHEQPSYDSPKPINQFKLPPNLPKSPWQEPKPSPELKKKIQNNQSETPTIQRRSPVPPPSFGPLPTEPNPVQIKPPMFPPSSIIGPKPFQGQPKPTNPNQLHLPPSRPIPPKSPELRKIYDKDPQPKPADNAFWESLSKIIQNPPEEKSPLEEEEIFTNSQRKPSNVSNISYRSDSDDSFDSSDEEPMISNDTSDYLTPNPPRRVIPNEMPTPRGRTNLPPSRRHAPMFVNRPLPDPPRDVPAPPRDVPAPPREVVDPPLEHYDTPSNIPFPIRPPPEPPRSRPVEPKRPVLALPKPPAPMFTIPSPEPSPATADEYYYEPDFVNFMNERWFYDVDRNEAKRMLLNKPDGSFIIRKSATHICTLVVVCNNKLYNLGLSNEDGSIIVGKASKDKKRFSSVREVVDFFTQNNLPLIYDNKEIYIKLKHM